MAVAAFLAPLDHLPHSLITASIVVATTISAGICYYLMVKRSNYKKQPPLPPGPRGVPVLGYIPIFHNRTPIHREFTALAAEYGPIFKLRVGSQLLVVVNSPALAKQVLRENESVFSSRSVPLVVRVCTYGGLDLASIAMGPDWASMRRVAVGKALSKAGLDGCYELRRREVMKSLSELEVGKPVGVFELAHKVVWNATLGMVWGGDVDYEETREVGTQMLRLLGKPNVSDVFPMLARFDLQGIGREGAVVARRFDRIVSAAIEKRSSGGRNDENKEGDENEISNKDLLQVLLESGAGSSLASMSHFKALLQDIAVAGNENISRMIEWALSELLNNGKAMKAVNRELDEIVGVDSLVEDHHLRDLKCLDAVVKETIRLHLGLVSRTANRPCVVGGFTIPQGSEVVVNAWAIHRDPQFWDEPSEFRPERFLGRGNGRPTFDFMGSSSSFRYIPFGSGRRICAGVNLAERLLKYVLASFLHCFEWKLVDGEGGVVDFADEFALLIKKKRPLIAVPTPRLLTRPELLA